MADAETLAGASGRLCKGIFVEPEACQFRVDQEVTTLPALPGHVGVVKEVIPSYADKTIGYNLALEGDPRPERVWFFLQHQLTLV